MFKIEAIVVGAGVIGLSIARALAARGLEVLVLESESGIGQGISSRNSEVIHAGLYYEPGSLKARLCVEGRRALYQYCGERNVPHRRCGKLVVATATEEDAVLAALSQRRAKAARCSIFDQGKRELGSDYKVDMVAADTAWAATAADAPSLAGVRLETDLAKDSRPC